MAVAAWGNTIKVSGGTAIVITNEACTSLGGGVYQVTNTARRILDPATAIVVKDTGVTVAASFYSLDILFGKVTFSGYTPTGAVTVTGAYLPMTAIGEARAVAIDCKADMLDSTTYDANGVRVKVAGLRDFTLSFEYLSAPVTDLDSGTVGTQTLQVWREAGTAKVVEVKLGAAYFRGWGSFETSESLKAGVADLNVFSCSLSGDAQGATSSCSMGT